MPLDEAEFEVLARLLRVERWGCLATVEPDGAPLAAMVAFVADNASGDLLLHLSTLSRHTRNLLERPRVSLAVAERDDGRADPQTLARIAVQGEAGVVARQDAEHPRLRARYLAGLPEAERCFGFADFHLLRVAVSGGRYVGGFARAFAVDAAIWQRAAAAAGEGTVHADGD